ncbi:MAG: MBL fold metallo-hydrolase [Deltaproteobacteria bacterium]|nr:MBL fold metallo-hydrolase [Deltaproteobacteria bacterium]
MRVRFWGVRGSIPVPGTDTLRFGGNTACVEVSAEGAPTVVLDCGSGARPLGRDLLTRSGRDLCVLLSHYHLDHVLGLPFFDPMYAPSFQIRVVMPDPDPPATDLPLKHLLNGRFHPVRLPEIPPSVRFESIRPGATFPCGPIRIRSVPLIHPGGSCGYRITHGRRSLVYFTDTAPFAQPGEGLAAGRDPTEAESRILDVVRGADVLVYDTMFTLDQFITKMSWGHSYPEYAVALARAAEVAHLVLYHHAPDANDADLEEIAARWADHSAPAVSVAREGGAMDLEG